MNRISEASQYYDQHASEFAAQASNPQMNSFEYYGNMPALLEMVEQITGNVLDFGCGAGNFTNLLNRDSRTVSGCDSSPNLIDFPKNNYPDINFFEYDGLTTLPDPKYDLIVAKLVFHYIDELELVIGNLSKSLSDDGFLCFSVPHPDKSQVMVNNSSDESSYVDQVGSFGLTLRMVHRSEDRYLDILKNSGLKIRQSITVSDNGKPKRLNILAIKS